MAQMTGGVQVTARGGGNYQEINDALRTYMERQEKPIEEVSSPCRQRGAASYPMG